MPSEVHGGWLWKTTLCNYRSSYKDLFRIFFKVTQVEQKSYFEERGLIGFLRMYKMYPLQLRCNFPVLSFNWNECPPEKDPQKCCNLPAPSLLYSLNWIRWHVKDAPDEIGSLLFECRAQTNTGLLIVRYYHHQLLSLKGLNVELYYQGAQPLSFTSCGKVPCCFPFRVCLAL